MLALGLLALFFGIAYYIAQTADTPPRLADPAPTAPPVPKADGSLPPQYRASYDPNARLLGVLAIVSPLLTTIIGFYFGQRAGEATGEAAKSEAKKKQAEITTALLDSGETEALRFLRGRGLIAPIPDDEPGPDPNAPEGGGAPGGEGEDGGGEGEARGRWPWNR
ncbi:hypothetical protein [Streptomyces sp. SAS_272]|uniref:hypothetical protein n=1 Tax=Streptomyces sp. SAS_272 TaxID=3412747 RepID=UPI00403C1118